MSYIGWRGITNIPRRSASSSCGTRSAHKFCCIIFCDRFSRSLCGKGASELRMLSVAMLLSACIRLLSNTRFYNQQALQPADYSMRKAWVSGGVEWCAFAQSGSSVRRSYSFAPLLLHNSTRAWLTILLSTVCTATAARNWSPGYCGHSTFTLSPVYAATVPTKRGDLLRLWCDGYG